MRRILTNARIIDPASGYDGPGGVRMEEGLITDWGKHLAHMAVNSEQIVDCRGDVIAPGLVDLRVKTGEPGSEHRETLETASKAAVAGGITSMVVMPDTDPVIDTPALVDYLCRAGKSPKVLNRVYPAGALTMGLSGERMCELSLMQTSGASIFSNGDLSVPSANLLRRVMQYSRSVDVPIMLRPDEPGIAGGVMNAGAFAARLGLKGLAPQAEWLGLQRDLVLAEMTGANVLIDQISTARSLEIIEDARKRGLTVSASVAAHSLFFNELDIGDGSQQPEKAYLTYCKVNPPFRAEDDRLALIAGLRDGKIDCVVSAHDPQPPEEKRLPFEEASFGAAGLETLLSALTSLAGDPFYELTLIDALKAVTCNPADILGLPQGRIAAGTPADLIRFNPSTPWKCEREDLRSRSRNSPFDGRLLTGQVMETYVKGELAFQRNKAI